MAEFQIPSFLQNCSTDEFHAMMKEALPADLDVSEGSHAWNLTRPTALVAAEICEFILPEVIKLIFPEFSYGAFLDYHATTRGMSRRPATYASGYVTITGTPQATIPAWSKFSTASVNDEPSVDYMTLEAAVIPETGTVTVPVECVKSGLIGNTGPNTIIILTDRLNGIKSVTNDDVITGGTETEDDETLIERIMEYDRTQGESFVGCVADYKRWATSVDGVGDATIIPPEDTSGLVTIVLTDTNGDPGTDQLCEDVYNYIMRPDEPGARRAPVNALLSVIPPDTIAINVKAIIELKPEYTLENVQTSFAEKVAAYLPTAMDEGEIKYIQIARILASAVGVNDFRELQIGELTGGAVTYGVTNIPISNRELPRISVENLTFTAGTV